MTRRAAQLEGKAERLAADHDPDLVLLDLHLPDMPGQEVLRRLQTNPQDSRDPGGDPERRRPPRPDPVPPRPGRPRLPDQPLDVRELLGLLDGIAADREQAGRA